jgi:hypothetical protein
MMVAGMIFLAGGLYLFIATNYVSKYYIITIGIAARFINGIVMHKNRKF